MPFDILVYRKSSAESILLIEVDGRQHFESAYGSKGLQSVQENDLDKEQFAVQQGIPLLRLYQPSIYQESIGRGGFDWKPYVKNMMIQAIEMKTTATVYRQPGEVAYRSGEYRDLRIGTSVEVVC